MPKRVGHLREKVLTLENCTRAVLVGTDNLKKTPEILHIRNNPERVGQKILNILSSGWVPGRVRIKIIREGTRGKVRRLKIPLSTYDHLCHVAIMLPLIPIIEKRIDFYSCGSIQGRGQKRVDDTIKSWMNSDKPPNYAGEADVHHAYESTTSAVVMKELSRLVKDKSYLEWHSLILDQMGGVLAIGFQPSHWYFNLVMDRVDKKVRSVYGRKLKYVRFMDNIVVTSNRKRVCHKAISLVAEECSKLGLTLNKNYQVFPTKSRAISMLSYRYYRGYNLMRKDTMYRITRGVKIARNNMCAHHCRSAMSQIGVVRHCNSYNYRVNHVYNTICIRKVKEVISNDDKKRLLRKQARESIRVEGS